MFKFPYTNFHELNLDWIIEKIKMIETAVTDAAASASSAKTSETNAAASQSAAAASATAAENYYNNIKDTVNIKGNTPYVADIFWRNVYGHFYTYASPPSEKIWSEIQGITTTDDTVIASFMPGDYYDNQPGNTNNRVNYVRLREFSKSTGTLIRESEDLLMYHANSLAYDAESGKIYVSAARNTETSEYISTICVVDYATFTVDGYHDVSGPEYIQSVSYNHASGLMGFGRWVCYFIDKDTWTLTRTLHLNNPLVRAHGSTQGAKHDDKHIYVSTYYPNAIIVYTIDGEFVKTFRNDREDRWEQEDIAIDNGVCWIAAHKRYYDRNSSGESHEDIPTIYRFNLDGSTLPKTIYEAVIDDYILHVDTTTTNTIQDGTSAYPCKSLMEAIWISDSTESIEHTIRITSNSVCRWLRLKRKTVKLEFQGATLAANCLFVQSNVYIQNAIIADVSGVSPYPYSSEGDVYIANGSSVTMAACTVTAEKRISIYRSKVSAPDITFNNTSGVTWCSNGSELSAEYTSMRTPKIKVTGYGTSFYQILNVADLSTINAHSSNNEVTISLQITFTDEENNSRTASLVYTTTAGDVASVISLYIPFTLSNGKVYVANFSYKFGDTLDLTLNVIYNNQNLGGTIKSYKFNVKRYNV